MTQDLHPSNIALKQEPGIYYVDWVIPPFRAMTIPPFGIFVKKEYEGDKQILNHDLIHWKQYERMGLFMYYFRYFAQLLIIGYDTMPMEMEARRFDDEETKWNYREHYHKPRQENDSFILILVIIITLFFLYKRKSSYF